MNKDKIRKEMAKSVISTLGTTQHKQDILKHCSIKDRLSNKYNTYHALLTYQGQAVLYVSVDNTSIPQNPFKINILRDIV